MSATLQERPLRVFLLGAGFQNENMGVRALAAGAVKCFLHQFPDAQLSLLDYANEPSTCSVRVTQRDVRIPLINIRFSKHFYLPNNIALLILVSLIARLVPSRRWRQRLLDANVVLRELRSADACLSVAGGDSFSDIYGLVRLIYVSLPQILALTMGIPLILLPQTLGPFKTRMGRWIAGAILGRATSVYCRDSLSMQLAASLAGSASDHRPPQFSYDMAFALDPVSPKHVEWCGLRERASRHRTLVGVNISGLLVMGGYTKSNMFGLKTSYPELMRVMINHLIETQGADVVLIPHVFGTDPTSESDAAACEALYRDLQPKYGDHIGFIASHHDQSEIKAIIGGCDFFIGARMHACIGALSQNVPAIAIAYSDKFKGVLQTLGVDRLVLDPRELGESEIINALSEAYKHRQATREELARRMPQVRSSVLNLFAFLRRSVPQSEPPVQEEALSAST